MHSKSWLTEREQDWHRAEQLLGRHQPLSLMSPDEIRELGLAYRAVINDLARIRSAPEYQHLAPYLNNLAQRLHVLVHHQPATRWQDLLQFFTTDFPRCFRKNLKVIGTAFLVFLIGTMIAMLTVQLDPRTAEYFLPQAVIEQVRQGRLWTESIEAAPSQSSFLMSNNIRVAINAYAMGMLFGIGTLYIMFSNGLFAFGGPLQICFQYGMGERLLLFMLPHGVIELTTIFIAGGAGMIVGLALLFPGDLPRWDAMKERAKESLILIAGCVPLLIVAGIIEGMISLNPKVPDAGRITVSILSGIILFSYLGLAGRTRKSAE